MFISFSRIPQIKRKEKSNINQDLGIEISESEESEDEENEINEIENKDEIIKKEKEFYEMKMKR